MKYSLHHNNRKSARVVRGVFLGIFILLLAISVGGVYVLYENLKSSNFNSEEQTISAPVSTYVAPSIQVFNTPYFQFQANKSWSEDAANSGEGIYAYRSLKNGLLEHQLVIYVNNIPPSLSAQYVLPVTIGKAGELKATRVSGHCGAASNYRTIVEPIILNGIRMKCDTDQTRYSVLTGQVGGSTMMSLAHNGGTANYAILYKNVTTQPDAVSFNEILDTFRPR